MWSPRPFVPSPENGIPIAKGRIVASFPHDPDAFTQGLHWEDGVLYEGTGLDGRSSIRAVALETGAVLRRRDLPPPDFGEGIAVLGSSIFQLTWTSGVCHVYDRETWEPKKRLRYRGEGWGLTHDGARLVMSNGSPFLRFRDPETFAATETRLVTHGGRPLFGLNALCWVEGEVLANLWGSDFIARIDPATGSVVGWIDLGGLLSDEERQGTDVLNGIAYEPSARRLFVTGKLWPRLFEIDPSCLRVRPTR